nr:M67 family metallopeptidase [Salinirubrum litoreum]
MPTDVRETLVSEASDGSPAEICGVLLGTGRASETVRVIDSRQVPNVADDPRTRYELDPGETAQVFESVERGGESADDTASESRNTTEVVGFYHSHPRGPPGPSATDRAQAQWPGYVYLIVSLASESDATPTTDGAATATEAPADADAEGVGAEGAGAGVATDEDASESSERAGADIGAWRWTGDEFESLAVESSDDEQVTDESDDSRSA